MFYQLSRYEFNIDAMEIIRYCNAEKQKLLITKSNPTLFIFRTNKFIIIIFFFF